MRFKHLPLTLFLASLAITSSYSDEEFEIAVPEVPTFQVVEINTNKSLINPDVDVAPKIPTHTGDTDLSEIFIPAETKGACENGTCPVDDDLSAMAPGEGGVFLDDNEEDLPQAQNSVVIANSAKGNNLPAKSAVSNSQVAGSFTDNEEGGITAEVDPRDRCDIVNENSFKMGYQFATMNYNEDGSSDNIIYNGVFMEYTTHLTEQDIMFRAGIEALGGTSLKGQGGAVWLDSKFLLGKTFELNDGLLELTPYIGAGLRYTHNLYADTQVSARNSLQLYVPMGAELVTHLSERMSITFNGEFDLLMFGQYWTDKSTSGVTSSYTQAPASGVGGLLSASFEYVSGENTFGVTPYYQYFYNGIDTSVEESGIASNGTHIAGLRAYIEF